MYNECFPSQTEYKTRKPWLTQGLKLSIRHKNKLYITYRKQQTLANLENYKQYKSRLNRTLKFALMYLVVKFTTVSNEENYVLGLFIDLRKAFDIVEIEILLNII